MSIIESRNCLLAALSVFVTFASSFPAASAPAPTFGVGRWIENTQPVESATVIDISGNSFRIAAEITYRIKSLGSFGSGRLLQVVGRNRTSDPYGCGRRKLVSFIIIESLPPPIASLPKGLKVTFYGGSDRPQIETLANDPHVCEVHPYRLAPGRYR